MMRSSLALLAFAVLSSAALAEDQPITFRIYPDFLEKAKVQKIWAWEAGFKVARNVGSANRSEGARIWEEKKPREGFVRNYTDEALAPADDKDQQPRKLRREY